MRNIDTVIDTYGHVALAYDNCSNVAFKLNILLIMYKIYHKIGSCANILPASLQFSLTINWARTQ